MILQKYYQKNECCFAQKNAIQYLSFSQFFLLIIKTHTLKPA